MVIWRLVSSSEETRFLGSKVSNPGSATTHSSTAGRQNIFKYGSFEFEMVLLKDSRFLGFLFAKTNESFPFCNFSNKDKASHTGQREPASNSLRHKTFIVQMGVAEASRMTR